MAEGKEREVVLLLGSLDGVRDGLGFFFKLYI